MTQHNIDSLFARLWENYVQVTPSAKRIHSLLAGEENSAAIVNDHVAFRTFNHAKVNLDKLAAHFLALGYKEGGQYNFAAKKLDAKHFEHPDTTKPKVFISELRVDDLSNQAQQILSDLIAQIPDDIVKASHFLYSGRHWTLAWEDYRTLLRESEYAAWLAAWGFRVNHFTVSVNHLRHFETLEKVNQLLKQAGFILNTAGGEIKGGKSVHLAQSSIMADKVDLAFNDGTHSIPSCFYEFAQRFALPNGQLYQGFVEASADKIFESTNAS